MLKGEKLTLSSTALVVSFLMLFAGVLSIKVSDYDLWWHLALGRDILAQGSPFLPDTFSFSFPGSDQFNGEWLADLMMFMSYDVLGLSGIYLFKFLVLALVFTGLYKTCTLYSEVGNKRDFALAVLSLVVVLFALRFRLFIRPYLLSYLCFTYFVFALNRAQLGKFGQLFWFMIVVEMFWANTSKGAFLGVLLVGIYGVDRLLNKKLAKADVAALLGVALASLVNPEGWRVYELLLGFAGGDTALSLTSEQQPLSLQMLWGAGWSYTFCYQILVVAAIVYLVVFNGWRNVFHLLSFIVFLGFSISLIRMIDFFALLSGLFFFMSARAMVMKSPVFKNMGSSFWDASVSILCLCLMFAFVPGNQTYAFGIGVKENIFPERAVEFLKANNIQGRLFNSYPFGGYLTFFHPTEKVFIDGRGYHLYPTDFQTEYLRAIGEKEIWRSLDQRWGFEIALLEYDHMSFGRHFARHITNNPEWALVYWDEKSTIYLRRLGQYEDVIGRFQYKVVRPNFNGFSYINALLKKRGPRLIEEIEDDLQKSPGNQEVRLAKVFALYGMNRKLFRDEIRQELLVCTQLYPDVAMEYSGLALLSLEENNFEDAREMAEKALSIDPGDPGGTFVMEKLASKK